MNRYLIDQDSRNIAKDEFLRNCFSEEFDITTLPADGSFRTYDRVWLGEKTYILMNSPPQYYSVAPFVRVGKWLSDQGFSTPQIYNIDEANGFLLLEDFGNTSLYKYLINSASDYDKKEQYRLMIDLLVKLQSVNPPEWLEHFSSEVLVQELASYTDWYYRYVNNKEIEDDLRQEFLGLWREALENLIKLSNVVILRDYHVENLMKLDRSGILSLGILDFQDAVTGCPTYDLVSILEDARIDVDINFTNSLVDYYIYSMPSLSAEIIKDNYAILGAQRNSRVVGFFAKKMLRDNNDSYLRHIPRVLNYLRNNFKNHKLTKIYNFTQKYVDKEL